MKDTNIDVYKRLKGLNLTLPKPPALGGIYVPVKQVGSLLFVSGHGAVIDGKILYAGKVGKDITVEEGFESAKYAMLNMLGTLHAHLEDLNKIKSVVKILALVASNNGFNEQPKVVNGASQLLVDLFGKERGIGTRSAMGTNELPNNLSVEIEAIFEV